MFASLLYWILPEFGTLFICTKLPVFSIIRFPPAAIFTALVTVIVFPGLMVKVPPLWIDTLHAKAFAPPVITGLFVVFGIKILSDARGKLAGDQFEAVFQLVFVAPVQVLFEFTVITVWSLSFMVEPLHNV